MPAEDCRARRHAITLAVVRRIVDGFADGIGELRPAFKELPAPPIALQSVAGLDLDARDASKLLGGLALSPRAEAIDDEIATLRRAA
jgi:hypothetical protein